MCYTNRTLQSYCLYSLINCTVTNNSLVAKKSYFLGSLYSGGFLSQSCFNQNLYCRVCFFGSNRMITCSYKYLEHYQILKWLIVNQKDIKKGLKCFQLKPMFNKHFPILRNGIHNTGFREHDLELLNPPNRNVHDLNRYITDDLIPSYFKRVIFYWYQSA